VLCTVWFPLTRPISPRTRSIPPGTVWVYRALPVCWNGPSAAEYLLMKPSGIHQLFESQVERTPDAVAIVAGNRTVSYRDLNARANALAHHLLALGACPK